MYSALRMSRVIISAIKIASQSTSTNLPSIHEGREMNFAKRKKREELRSVRVLNVLLP